MANIKTLTLSLLILTLCISVACNPAKEILGSEQEDGRDEPAQSVSQITETTRDSKLFFSFEQSISDDLPLFIFRLNYRIENRSWGNNYIIESIKLSNDDGTIIQKISGLECLGLQVSPYLEYQFGVEFADFNFDGFLDFRIVRTAAHPHPLRWAYGMFGYFFWDSHMNKFILNQQLLDLEENGFWQTTTDFWSREYDGTYDTMGSSGVRFDEESQMLVFSSHMNGNWSYFPPLGKNMDWFTVIQYYNYRDGHFALVKVQEILYDLDGLWQVRELDVATGAEIISLVSATQTLPKPAYYETIIDAGYNHRIIKLTTLDDSARFRVIVLEGG